MFFLQESEPIRKLTQKIRGLVEFYLLPSFNPILIWLFLCNIDGGGVFSTPLHEFALRVEIGKCDTCPSFNFSRPAHLEKLTSNFHG